MVFDEHKYREYANCFWDELNSTFFQKRGRFGYLPMVFAELPTDAGMKHIKGVTSIHTNEKRQTYSCFPIVFIRFDSTDKQLFQTIRHETIHYFLALHYYNHQDNSALFALVCGLFDGDAYESLSDKGQAIYDASKTYFEEAYAIYASSKDDADKCNSLAIKLSMMLTEIDDAEQNQTCDINSLKSTLSLILKWCKSRK